MLKLRNVLRILRAVIVLRIPQAVIVLRFVQVGSLGSIIIGSASIMRSPGGNGDSTSLLIKEVMKRSAISSRISDKYHKRVGDSSWQITHKQH
jgi:hypothetical protein